MAETVESYEERPPGGRFTRFHFINAESGRVMRSERPDASDGSAVILGPARGETRDWWAIEPADFGAPVSDRWRLSNAASNHRTVLSVGPPNEEGERRVQLELRSEASVENQLWFFEHYPPVHIMPRWAPMLPGTTRLWCMPVEGEPVILTLTPNWSSEPFLVARPSPDEGGTSHWLPIMLAGETHD
jgi:hypothetical protein